MAYSFYNSNKNKIVSLEKTGIFLCGIHGFRVVNAGHTELRRRTGKRTLNGRTAWVRML